MTGIAISGRAGSGKSTFAGLLVEMLDEAGIPSERMSFADELKREVFELYGITKDDVGGRDVLIRHGEARRLADPDVYIRPVDKRARLAQVCGILPVIDDLRFRREYEWAGRCGLVTVRVVATMAWRASRLSAQGFDGSFAWSGEVGEVDLDGLKHDWGVLNGPGAKLRERAVGLLEALQKEREPEAPSRVTLPVFPAS